MRKILSAIFAGILVLGIVPVSANQPSHDVEIVFSWPVSTRAIEEEWGILEELYVTLFRGDTEIVSATVVLEEDEFDSSMLSLTFRHTTTAYRTGNVVDFDGQGHMIDMMATHGQYSIDVRLPDGLIFSDQGMHPPYLDFYAIMYNGEWAGGFSGKPGIIVFELPAATVVPTERAMPASTGIGVLIDGIAIEMDVEPIIIDGRTFAPVRAIVEALGAEARWSDEERAVHIVLPGSNRMFDIRLVIDDVYIVVASDSGPAEWIRNDVAPIIHYDRTMLPVRAIAEIMGFEVEWDGENQNVIITT